MKPSPGPAPLAEPSHSHLRILLVDDSLDFLESATRFFSVDPRLEIVGRATSGAEAIEQVARLRPDLVLMDLVMPDISGLDATQHIKAREDAPRVIILTLHDVVEYRNATSAIGADGFVTKLEVGDQLLPLIYTLFPTL